MTPTPTMKCAHKWRDPIHKNRPLYCEKCLATQDACDSFVDGSMTALCLECEEPRNAHAQPVSQECEHEWFGGETKGEKWSKDGVFEGMVKCWHYGCRKCHATRNTPTPEHVIDSILHPTEAPEDKEGKGWEDSPEWKVILSRIQGVESMAQIHGAHAYHGTTIQEFITTLLAQVAEESRMAELEWFQEVLGSADELHVGKSLTDIEKAENRGYMKAKNEHRPAIADRLKALKKN